MKNCPICTYHFSDKRFRCPACGSIEFKTAKSCTTYSTYGTTPGKYVPIIAAHGCIRQERRQFGQSIRIELCDAVG